MNYILSKWKLKAITKIAKYDDICTNGFLQISHTTNPMIYVLIMYIYIYVINMYIYTYTLYTYIEDIQTYVSENVYIYIYIIY